MDYENDISEIAKSVAQNKYDWVLILGTGVSYDNMAAADQKFGDQIIHLQQEYERQKEDSVGRKEICQAVQERDYAKIKKILYGDVWSEVSFLYTDGLLRKARREAYAESFAVKEEMNLERCPNLDLRTLLEIFPGIVLTTCQDETVEAFLEDKECMSVENQVYTPDILTTLPYWDKWVEKEHILFKLYGTCKDPQFLLLSEEDMNMYYPEQGCSGSEELYTMEALSQLFQTKNLLFIGMELPEGREALNRQPVLAQGIMNLLKRELQKPDEDSKQLKRYIILEDIRDEELWKDCHITSIVCSKKDIPQMLFDLKERIAQEDHLPITMDTIENNETGLDKKTAEAIFWSTYNRRSRHHISKRECHILERHIWNAPNETDIVNFNRDEMRLLAMAANNYAEFGDLWKVMEEMKSRYAGNIPCDKEAIIKDILSLRIDNNGKMLLQVLNFYGEGFPMGFLSLMSEDEKELKVWKKAGIQLTNSGIYIQSRKRKKIYEQIGYADSLMQTAGSMPGKKEFGLSLQEKAQQMKDSYFYPMSVEIVKNENADETKRKYLRMFDRMILILKDRSEGYSHIRSLLETELPAILGTITKLEHFEKKPILLYYLFRECQMQPENAQEFLEEIEKQNKGILWNTKDIDLLEKKLMLCQVMAMIKSQNQNEGHQKEAIKICEEAERVLTDIRRRLADDGKLLHESIFLQEMQIVLLKGRINGKLASIQEIARCHESNKQGVEYRNEREAQKRYLNGMKESLDSANTLMKKRTDSTGNAYELLRAETDHQYGEYCFKQSQYYSENLKYRDEREIKKKRVQIKEERGLEKENYEASKDYYKSALNFYRKYPEQYRLQEASVLRNLADLYCRMHKSGYFPTGGYDTKCYQLLQEAYMYYRSYNNLHGIADILQSMGEMEDFKKTTVEKRRSAICFYHAAAKLYDALGDGWSNYVLSAFLQDARKDLAD